MTAHRFDSLQIVRAMAAMAVVWAHSEGLFDRLQSTPAYTFNHFDRLGIGSIGVDIFFVLSGFVMASTAHRAASGGAFLKARLWRIVPLYFTLSAVWLTIAVLWGEPGMADRARSAFLFWPVWGGRFFYPVLGPGWTLSFEMLFYVYVSICLVGGRWARPALLGLIVLAMMAATVGIGGGTPAFVGHPLLVEFAAGWVIARTWKTERPWLGLLLACLATIGGIGLLLNGSQDLHKATEVLAHPGLGWRRVALWGPVAICTVLAAVNLDAWSGIRALRPAVYLGDASYSIYLIHPFAIAVIEYFPIKPPAAVIVPLAIALSVAAGVVCYECLEKPLGLLRPWLRSRTPAATPAGTGSLFPLDK